MSEDNNIDVSIELILAAILSANGKQAIPLDSLMRDYSNYTVAINQEEDGQLSFELVEVTDESK